MAGRGGRGQHALGLLDPVVHGTDQHRQGSRARRDITAPRSRMPESASQRLGETCRRATASAACASGWRRPAAGSTPARCRREAGNCGSRWQRMAAVDGPHPASASRRPGADPQRARGHARAGGRLRGFGLTWAGSHPGPSPRRRSPGGWSGSPWPGDRPGSGFCCSAPSSAPWCYQRCRAWLGRWPWRDWWPARASPSAPTAACWSLSGW
jgi:hypothetical protein